MKNKGGEEQTELIALQGKEGNFWVPYKVKRTLRAKRLKMTWTQDHCIQLTLPWDISLNEGMDFMREQSLWVEKQIDWQAKQQQNASSLWAYFKKKNAVSHKGKWLPCEIRFVENTNKIYLTGEGEKERLILVHPPVFTEGDLDLSRMLRSWANWAVPLRVTDLGMCHGVLPARTTTRNQEQRWGSCSIKKRISLNWRLVLLPPELHDYVILHELAHLKEMNHSKQFWSQLEEWCPEALALDKELKEWGWLLNIG